MNVIVVEEEVAGECGAPREDGDASEIARMNPGGELGLAGAA
jgi:hypothetical protein